jgi:cysteine-rich repeat protein
MLEPACGNGLLDTGEACDDGNLVDGDGCSPTCTVTMGGIVPFDWTVGYDPGLGHGSVGGVGFRSTALPIIVHITDAPSHECTDYTTADPACTAHCSTETFTELNALGAKVIAVASYVGTTAIDPLGIVNATGSVVPPCAFDGSDARTAGRCAPGQCCTGISGASVAPDGDGNCPLVFLYGSGGTGVDTSIVRAIDALTQYVSYSLTAVPRDDPSDSVDATCFVESVGIVGSVGPSGTCPVTPTAVDLDGDTVTETLEDATPRTRVTFSIAAVNTDVNDVDGDGNITEACAATGSYGLFLDVTTDTGTVVATRRVVVDVP